MSSVCKDFLNQHDEHNSLRLFTYLATSSVDKLIQLSCTVVYTWNKKVTGCLNIATRKYFLANRFLVQFIEVNNI